MLKFIKYILPFLFAFLNMLSFAQTKDDLQKQKQLIEREIEETNNQLKKEKKKKNSALIELELSNKKINQQNDLLTNLESSIKLQNIHIENIENNIQQIEKKIQTKESELKNLKESYSKLIYQTYVWRNTYNETYFLISSKDLNQLYKRKQYLKQLTFHRANKITNIKIITEQLSIEKQNLIHTKEELINQKYEKEQIFLKKQKEKNILEEEKKKNKQIINKIKQDEEIYKEKIINKTKESQKLDNQIKKIIEEEIRKSRELAKKNNTGSPFTPEMKELSSNFKNNKGKLPWPLEKGIIIQHYGKQKHQVIAGIETVNNGINFSTDEGEMCRVIFDGIVSRIFVIKGKGKAILVNHGDYYTVYSGVKNILVKTGEKVISKQKLGTVMTTGADSETELHFEIWKGKETENPVKWLYKAY